MSFRHRNERNSGDNVKRRSQLSPTPGVKDPSMLMTVPSSSKDKGHIIVDKEEIPFKTRFKTYLHNEENDTYCGRTCKNWLYITVYGIMYLLFLCTYGLVFLYFALWILKLTSDFNVSDRPESLKYLEHGVGLSATPTGITSYPIVSYRLNKAEDYEQYLNALDNLLDKRRKSNATLGTCGERPYGFGQSPCIVLRINKQYKWAGKPLLQNSTESMIAPKEVQSWLKRDKKLWLHCSGYHSYDKEHIGRIRYFPDPPGFDPDVFPLKREDNSPLIAIQIANFTLGVSLAVECKLWYVNGPSSIDFILYVESDDKRLFLDRT